LGYRGERVRCVLKDEGWAFYKMSKETRGKRWENGWMVDGWVDKGKEERKEGGFMCVCVCVCVCVMGVV
jgi:hypothetical protein